jgi:hypothetical protein
VNDSESSRFILNQTEVLGPKVNFHYNSRTKRINVNGACINVNGTHQCECFLEHDCLRELGVD